MYVLRTSHSLRLSMWIFWQWLARMNEMHTKRFSYAVVSRYFARRLPLLNLCLTNRHFIYSAISGPSSNSWGSSTSRCKYLSSLQSAMLESNADNCHQIFHKFPILGEDLLLQLSQIACRIAPTKCCLRCIQLSKAPVRCFHRQLWVKFSRCLWKPRPCHSSQVASSRWTWRPPSWLQGLLKDSHRHSGPWGWSSCKYFSLTKGLIYLRLGILKTYDFIFVGYFKRYRVMETKIKMQIDTSGVEDACRYFLSQINWHFNVDKHTYFFIFRWFQVLVLLHFAIAFIISLCFRTSH